MFSKIWLINIVLVVLVGFFSSQAYETWTNDNQGMLGEKAGPPSPGAQMPPQRTQRFAVKKTPREPFYEVVATKNLFFQERSEYVEEEEESPEPEPEPEEVKKPKKRIFLHGVIVTENYRVALVSTPDARGRQRGQMTVRIGDVIEDMMVTDIERERIVLRDGDQIFEVALYDEGKPKRAPVPKSPPASKPKVVTSGGEKGESPAEKKEDDDDKAKKKQPKATGDASSKGKFTTVETPFGKIKKRITPPQGRP